MEDDIFTMNHVIMFFIILIMAVFVSLLKTEPEPFKNMVEGGRGFYNKHKRLVRKAIEETTETLTNRVKTSMRLAGF